MAEPLTKPASILYRLAGSLRAVEETEMNPFSRAIEVLRKLAEAMQTPIAIVGGLAGIYHRALVTTLDIDIVVPQERLDDVVDEAAKLGLVIKKHSPAGWHVLEFEDPEGAVTIEVIPAGQKSPRDPDHAPPIPSPQELGVNEGLGYASFAGWVRMKLVAGRDKDRYHLIEALQHASQQNVATVVEDLRGFPSEYLQEFQRLVQASEDENQESW